MKDLGQECWAFLGFPAEAKDKARQIFNQPNTYNLVFDETLTAIQLLLPHVIYEAANAKTKGEPTYALPTNDPAYEQFKEARIATEHLRHPIVAAVGLILGGVQGTPPAYLAPEQSAHLIANTDDWLELLVDRAFASLARRLLLESVRGGTGPRSVVRSNDWMNETMHYLTEQFIDRVNIERANGNRPGTLAYALPFVTT